jgi:hypothetical protein
MRFDKINVIDKAKKSLNLMVYLLTPINALIFASTVLGVRAMKIFKNGYIINTVGCCLLIISLFIFIWIIIPVFNMMRFNWKIKNYRQRGA